MYYRRRREDESIYLVAKKGDWILTPHQCEKSWFVNLCGRCPDSGSLADSQTFVVLQIDHLDIFGSRDTETIHGMLGFAKELVRISRGEGREDPFPVIIAWTVGDEVGMGVEIHILEKLSSKRRNGRNYLQLNMVRQFRAEASDIYSDIYAACYSRYSLKYHHISVLHMYLGAMKSSLMERFFKGTKNRTSEDSDRNKLYIELHQA